MDFWADLKSPPTLPFAQRFEALLTCLKWSDFQPFQFQGIFFWQFAPEAS